MMKMTSMYALILLIFSILSTNVFAKTYKCRDENGNITYSQTACESNQKVDKVISSSNGSAAKMNDCKYAGKFAKIVVKRMRSGRDAQQTFEHYGGIDNISNSTLGIINYIYTYSDVPDVSAGKIVSLTKTKCNAKSFGSVACEDFPDEFQASIDSCDEELQQQAKREREMLKRILKGKKPEVDPDAEAKAKEAYEARLEKQKIRNEEYEKERIQSCNENYDLKIERITDMLRQKHSASKANELRAERRLLQKAKNDECG